ncbi:flavin reductase family protein [Streptomyces griseoloalbus]|uniref:Flavin reductase family protein n=1 Tax=Streptomyces griseoloalbus TaxID=67303 RepID=A0ABV3E841_9ACTN
MGRGAAAAVFKDPHHHAPAPDKDPSPRCPQRLLLPALDQAVATLDVRLHAELDGGDHVLTLLRVTETHVSADEDPLVFYASRRCRLAN